jgi:hypothetical protein
MQSTLYIEAEGWFQLKNKVAALRRERGITQEQINRDNEHLHREDQGGHNQPENDVSSPKLHAGKGVGRGSGGDQDAEGNQGGVEDTVQKGSAHVHAPGAEQNCAEVLQSNDPGKNPRRIDEQLRVGLQRREEHPQNGEEPNQAQKKAHDTQDNLLPALSRTDHSLDPLSQPAS